MYNRFFGFKERPFKLVPNPAYLFLGKSHQEAMAHLVYAVDAGDGFVELTGEVGTGKTTLCRAFFENLDENTEVAYIFNPVVDPVELIKAINAEFKISSEADNTKDLIDTLNSFLIEKNAQDKDVLLVIDEGQNLTSEVLEQIRLISNLETTQNKLLQIVLVGQPELSILLDSHSLRQLRQRITLSCRLQPLTYKETVSYIHHRVRIASGEQVIMFSQDAIRRIYKYSRGIPRLINIACDRALLAAYGFDQKKVSAKTANIAVSELGNRGRNKRFDFKAKKQAAAVAVVACFFAAVVLVTLYFYGILNRAGHVNVPDDKPGKNKAVSQFVLPPAPTKPAPVEASPTKMPPVDNVNSPKSAIHNEIGLETVVKDQTLRAFRAEAFKTAMAIWGVDADSTHYLSDTADDLSFFKLAARQNGFIVYRLKNNLDLMLRLNLPAILKFNVAESKAPVYLVLTKIVGEKLILKGPKDNDVITASRYEAGRYWSGMAYIPWKNFFALTGTIPIDSARESIITLKLLLRDIGFKGIELNPVYDQNTREAIASVQIRHALPVDGIVGSMTKIALYNEKGLPEIPHLNRP